MARMSVVSGMNEDLVRYQVRDRQENAFPELYPLTSQAKSISLSYMQQWLGLSVSSDKTHILGNFGNETSSGVIYNLFADKLLQLDLVPQSVSSFKTNWDSQVWIDPFFHTDL